MTWALSNFVQDWLGQKRNRLILQCWGAQTPVSMGDGVRFRVTNSRFVDYIYIRYESGLELFEVETGVLEGTGYHPQQTIHGIPADSLMQRISLIVFGLPEPAKPPLQLSFRFRALPVRHPKKLSEMPLAPALLTQAPTHTLRPAA